MSGKFFNRKQFGEGQIYIDMSDSINAQNFLSLQGKRPVTLTKLNIDTGMSSQDIRRYITNGFFEQISLTDTQTQSQTLLNAIDLASETTQKELERLKSLNNMAPKISKQVSDLREQRKRVMIPISYLSKMGYGYSETILQALNENRIQTLSKEITTKAGDKKMTTFADISASKARDVLKYLKNHNKNLCSVGQLAKKAKVSVTEIEEAILSGEIKPIRECLYAGDDLEITIDLANKSNAEFLDKKLFEAELIKQDKNQAKSLRTRLTWYFCPQTRTAASEAFAKNKESLDAIKKQIKDTKELLVNPNLKPEEVDDLEDLLLKLEESEKIETKKTFGYMWSLAGTQEYKKASAQAKELIKLYKTQEIDSIVNEDARAIFEAK